MMLSFAKSLRALGCLALALSISAPAVAGEVRVAVAANFAGTLENLRGIFETTGNHKLTLISGATGKFAAQIAEGAPFDVFLSADDQATKKLVEDGEAVTDTEFTYAIGTLVLYSPDAGLIKGDGEAVLKAGNFSRLAIANPRLAPYGVAAEATLKALGVDKALKDKIVMGENIGQTFAMVHSGGAELGFVALSHVLGSGAQVRGSFWIVPGNLHPPIRQNAVLLMRGKNKPAARAFLQFLRSREAREKIKAEGYTIE
jgi:molybdate transport system substrate-binding protein